MRRRFFVESFDSGSAVLHGESAEHLGRVLRAAVGQLYELSDGYRVWLGRVERTVVSKREGSRIEFSLIEPVPAREPSLHVQLLIAVVKFDRFEWCLEKATELGVTSITPLAAARTDKPLLAAAQKRGTRWERILLESAQQSRRLRPPTIGEAMEPAKAFALSPASRKILLSERREASPLRKVLPEFRPSGNRDPLSAALAIGPEGGWADAEIASACAAGFAEASLGENIVRTETAVLAALSILQFVLGD